MKEQEANIAIAEADGLTILEKEVHPAITYQWVHRKGDMNKSILPSYTGPSGDPIRLAISRMTEEEQIAVVTMVRVILPYTYPSFHQRNLILASPLTLCTAYLRVHLNDPALTITDTP